MEGILHTYHPDRQLNLFEYTPSPSGTTNRDSKSQHQPSNVILFVGGLYDNFGAPGYVGDLAKLFPRHENQQWAVMHIQLSSAMKGFGIVDIDQDIEEIAVAVTFIREQFRRRQQGEEQEDRSSTDVNVVLMGHSTGCQDTLHYLHSKNPTDGSRPLRPHIQGAILQAPVSDRELVTHGIKTDPEFKKAYESCMDIIEKTPITQHQTTILPIHLMTHLFGPAPLSISRFLSLASPSSPQNPSKEDLLSYDLSTEQLRKTFGNIGPNGLLTSRQILILLSDKDEYYTPEVSPMKSELLVNWHEALALYDGQRRDHDSNLDRSVGLHPSSQAIPNAPHDVSGNSTEERHARLVVLRGAVLRYIDDAVGHVDAETWRIYNAKE